MDMYSENPNGVDPYNYGSGSTQRCGSYQSEGDCYNREHMIPQSVFNSLAPMVSDAHFITPTDGKVNGIRSNYPHGNVSSATYTAKNGGKLGSSAVSGYNGTVFEPINEFKGDIARMYFYFATRYENTVAGYTTYAMFNGTSNQVFTTAFRDMLLQWHSQDPVSEFERARNNAIYNQQGNRNPYIDNPNYVNLIWGGTIADTTAPTAPTALSANGVTTTSFTLSWSPATDNAAVTSYNVYQNGVLKTSVTTTSTTISGLTASTSYNYTVKAKDAAGNLSTASTSLLVTTTTPSVDTTAPSTPTNIVSSNITTTGLTLSWTAATDNIGVTGYDIYQDGLLKTTTSATAIAITGLSSGTSYSYTVKAKDAAGNISLASTPLAVTTMIATGTTYCASTSNNTNDERIANITLNTINNSSTGANGYEDFTAISTTLNKNSAYTLTITPTWTASVYAEGYAAWIDFNKNGVFTDAGEQVASIAATSTTPVTSTITIPSTAVNGSTRMRVSMRYNAIPTACETLDYGQVEDYTITIADAITDTAAPSTPTNLSSSNVTANSCTLTWTAATDNVAVTSYDVYQGTTLKTTVTSTSASISGLTASTAYTFTVKAKDAAGNISNASNTVTVTTTATTAVSDLYFSEYVEGSSNNKALEITNKTGGTINLAAYTIKKQTNGSGAWSTGLALTGSLANNGKHVIVNSSISSTCYSTATANLATAAGEMAYNGNDAIGLFKNGTLIDIIGTFNGGTADYSIDETMQRKATAVVPKATFNKTTDWDIYGVDICSGLGNKMISNSSKKASFEVTIFPNPSNGNFELTFEDRNQNYSIEVYTTIGQKVLEINEIHSGSVGINHLNSGIYLVKINHNEESLIKQVIVE